MRRPIIDTNPQLRHSMIYLDQQAELLLSASRVINRLEELRAPALPAHVAACANLCNLSK
jgi:hypothetical protein